jgi:sugar phosphate isomerase/epimerase
MMRWESEMSGLRRAGHNLILCVIAALILLVPQSVSAQETAPCRHETDAKSAADDEYGAQLYTVRAGIEADLDEALCRVAKIGYREVEFAGLFGRSPTEVRARLDAHGLRAIASHANWQQLRDTPQQAIDDAKVIGASYLVLAWLPPEERQTLAQWENWIARLNTAGKIAHDQGMELLYHAHDFEYQAIDGVRPIDLLFARLDPAYVNFEMDIYWTVKGGEDPRALLRRYPGRFPLAHIKDMHKTNESMADVGDGRIDFAGIFAAADPRDFKHKFVERDDGDNPFHSLARSLTYLKNLKTKEWQ